MENVLRGLFEFQKFEENKDLQRVIDSVHARYSGKRKLSLDEAEYVHAAGSAEAALGNLFREREEK